MNTRTLARRTTGLAAALWALTSPLASAQVLMAGRPMDPNKNVTLSAGLGKVIDIDGTVEETNRRLYDILGLEERQSYAESYDLNDLGLSESEPVISVGFERIGKFVTFRGTLGRLNASASGVAKRDYFIGVEEIRFQGKDYEYMKIEEGETYEATLDGALINLRAQITPFTIAPENIVSFTPFLHLGLQVIGGTFDVRSGEPSRIQLYENPPREYVVGGHGEGAFGVFAPELGLGGEVRIFLAETDAGLIELSLQGTYAIFEYQGSSRNLGISARNDKDLDLEYDMAELRAEVNVPLNEDYDLVFGAFAQVISADGSSKAKIRSDEDAITRREKFDKDISLEMTYIGAFAGLRW